MIGEGWTDVFVIHVWLQLRSLNEFYTVQALTIKRLGMPRRSCMNLECAVPDLDMHVTLFRMIVRAGTIERHLETLEVVEQIPELLLTVGVVRTDDPEASLDSCFTDLAEHRVRLRCFRNEVTTTDCRLAEPSSA